jgi:hypothetical protein
MYPYYVEISNQADLYQLNDGRFQLVKQGPLDSTMVGFKYIVLKSIIADLLKKLELSALSWSFSKGFCYFG